MGGSVFCVISNYILSPTRPCVGRMMRMRAAAGTSVDDSDAKIAGVIAAQRLA